jgi:hypothetical protein
MRHHPKGDVRSIVDNDAALPLFEAWARRGDELAFQRLCEMASAILLVF